MSTVTVTDLQPGDSTTSTNVNATISSWNSATAAGQIAAPNVRIEGIDRRTLSAAGHVVCTNEAPAMVGSATNSGLVHSAVNAVVPLNGGVTPLQTPAITLASIVRIVLLHASVSFTCAPQVTGKPRLLVSLYLEVSTNGGAAWTPIAGTHQEFMTRETGNLSDLAAVPNLVPGLARCATWGITVPPVNGALYRVAYSTLNDTTAGGVDVIFQTGVIFTEVLRL